MRRWRGRVWAAVALALAGLGAPGEVRAQPDAGILQRLTPYDTEGDRTFEALRLLAQGVAAARSQADRAELSFVHAMACTDLWLIAQVRGDTALQARLASHLEVEVEALPAGLSAALDELRQVMRRESLDDALSAIASLQAKPGPPVRRLAAPIGTRTALTYLLRVASLGPEGAAPSLAQLASLSADPCAGSAPCGSPFEGFDAQGRRVVASLVRVSDARALLAKVGDHDPLLAALQPKIEASFAPLRQARFTPASRLEDGPECPAPEACGMAETAGILVFVEESRVRLAYAPAVRLGDRGGVRIEAAGEPVWPQSRTVEVDDDLKPFLRPLDDVTKVLSAMREADPTLQVAVGADGEARAHVWARVLLSARAAGFESPLALGRSPEGYARVQPVRVVPALAAQRLEPGELNVMMLMKGYSVRRLGPTVSIERKPGADGALEFDVNELVRSAQGEEAAHSSYLRFMPFVAADDVVSTAFAVAPRDERVTLILP